MAFISRECIPGVFFSPSFLEVEGRFIQEDLGFSTVFLRFDYHFRVFFLRHQPS